MSNATAEKTLTEETTEVDFTSLMADIAALAPQQQEKLIFFMQGYVIAATASNERDKTAIQ